MAAQQDLNSWDDWWNEGFDDYFDGARQDTADEAGFFAVAWLKGWKHARSYHLALAAAGGTRTMSEIDCREFVLRPNPYTHDNAFRWAWPTARDQWHTWHWNMRLRRRGAKQEGICFVHNGEKYWAPPPTP